MTLMKINFIKLNPNAVTPKRAHDTDAGFDLVATECGFAIGGMFQCKTGIAVEIPPGYFGAIFPRSSKYLRSLRVSLIFFNTVIIPTVAAASHPCGRAAAFR